MLHVYVLFGKVGAPATRQSEPMYTCTCVHMGSSPTVTKGNYMYMYYTVFTLTFVTGYKLPSIEIVKTLPSVSCTHPL